MSHRAGMQPHGSDVVCSVLSHACFVASQVDAACNLVVALHEAKQESAALACALQVYEVVQRMATRYCSPPPTPGRHTAGHTAYHGMYCPAPVPCLYMPWYIPCFLYGSCVVSITAV